MCGIAGIISFHSQVQEESLRQMAATLVHRGPESEGFYLDQQHQVGFAHRRLSIIDLSEDGKQPFYYGQYTIVFNGEIYNYRELKQQLERHGYRFTTQTDTEVIPAAFDHWGIDCLHHFDGMFAFALHNVQTNITIICRDRFGEKPLYFSDHLKLLNSQFIPGAKQKHPSGGLLFASEMKALWAAGVERCVDESMLMSYMALGFVQHPANKSKTFYKNIGSLPPGYLLQVNNDDKKWQLLQWYNPAEKIKQNSTLHESHAIEKFTELFETSIGRRLRSDVLIGSSLSGGIDSSAVVAVTRKILQSSGSSMFSSQCFTASFPGFEKDETAHAKLVADSLQLKQHFITPTATQLADEWQQLMYFQEEPVQSSSVFTQYMIYKNARENNVTVLLDGQGADELLGGYKKYSRWYLQQIMLKDPFRFLKEKQKLKANHLLEDWSIRNYGAALLPDLTAKRLRIRTRKQLLGLPFAEASFRHEFTDETVCEKPVIGSLEDLLMYNSFRFGLEELLRYADRNSMAHSLEVRLPFLFHELAEFVFSLPSHFKIRNGFTKWILRESMNALLPSSIVWRKNKIGFEPPQQEWLQEEALNHMILDARQSLVDARILDRKILNTPVEATAAHDAFAYDWRFLNVATILGKAL